MSRTIVNFQNPEAAEEGWTRGFKLPAGSTELNLKFGKGGVLQSMDVYYKGKSGHYIEMVMEHDLAGEIIE